MNDRPRIEAYTGDITGLTVNAVLNAANASMLGGGVDAAFPAISTGVYRYTKDAATEIAAGTVSSFVEEKAVPETVIFCCFDEQMAELYRRAIAALRKG